MYNHMFNQTQGIEPIHLVVYIGIIVLIIVAFWVSETQGR